MKTTLRTLIFAATLALTLTANMTGALAKDSKHGRETAWTDWTDVDPLPAPNEWVTEGVTWEE